MKKLILSFLIVPSLLCASIDFRAKGLYSVFRIKQYLSPVYGFAWWHGGQIEKLYRYGDPGYKTIELVRQLFYLNDADGLTFAPTILPIKIGTYFSPATIGIILNALDEYVEKKSLTASEEQKLEKTIEDALAKELKFEALIKSAKHTQDQLASQLKPEIKQAQKDAEKYGKEKKSLEKEKPSLEKDVQEYKQKITQLNQQLKSLIKKKPITDELKGLIEKKQKEIIAAKLTFEVAQQKLAALKTQIKEQILLIKKAVDIERRFENKIKNSAISEYALHNFVQLLVRAFEETLPDRKRFMPFTVHNILLAMLYKKVNVKKDFIQYFSKLDHSIFNDTALLTDNSPTQSRWLKEQYPQKSYQSIGSTIVSIEKAEKPKEKFLLLKNNFEEFIAAWYSYQVFTSIFPPQILSGWTRYQEYDFADCGSTSLRNTLNNLIYMPTSGVFLLSQLTNTFKVNDRVSNFYKEFGSVEKIQEQQTRNAWAEVTSGLTGGEGKTKVDYRIPPGKGVCQIAARTGIRNINNVIRQLLGIDTIDELQKLPNVKVTKQLGKDPNFGIYTFTINKKYTFKWYFEPIHFFISIHPYYIMTDETIAGFMKSIGSFFQKDDAFEVQQTNNMILSLLLLYRDRLSLFLPVIHAVANIGMPESYRYQIMLALLDTGSLPRKLQCIQKVLNSALVRNDKATIETIKQLIWEMKVDVKQEYSDILQVILASPVIQDDSYIYRKDLDKIVRDGINILKAHYPQLLSPVVDTIIAHKRDKYYGMLKKNVPLTKQQEGALEKLRAGD